MSSDAISVGRLIAGRWRVTAELEGEGRFRVADAQGWVGELLILPGGVDLRDQVKNLHELRHENIIAPVEAGSWGGTRYLVRELIAGMTVKDWLWREDWLEYDEALGVACQLCLASTELEKCGVNFIGFNAANVLVDPQGFAKVDPLRLGAAESEEGHKAPEERTTTVPDQQSDVFRIGLLIYRMLAGKEPARDKHGAVQLESISSVRPDVPVELDNALAHIMKTDPSERPVDGEALLDILHPLLMNKPRTRVGSEAAGKLHSGTEPRPVKWHEDKRFWLYTAFGLFALLILLFIVGNLLFPPPE